MKAECHNCAIGALMAHGTGGYCPFLEEDLAAGSVLFETGSVATFSWYLRSGIVGLVHENGSVEVISGPSDVLGPALVRKGRRTARAVALSEALVCRGANAVLPQPGEAT